jgi:DNA-binding NarL/FixJ family response regulator
LGGTAANGYTDAMETVPGASNQRVLILKADRLYAETLSQYVERALQPVQVSIAGSVAVARNMLAAEPIDLFITGRGESLEGDALDLIAQCTKPPFRARRVLVVTMRREYRAIAVLRTLSIDGVFDSAEEPPAAFTEALQTVLGGSRYWSQSIIRRLQQLATAPTALFRLLTDFEQIVLSVIGDGCDDAEAARQLRLSPATVSTVRRGLHRKLGVQHRGELVRVAAQKGYVRFTPDGVERPGFALLAAAYHPRDPKRRGSTFAPPALV